MTERAQSGRCTCKHSSKHLKVVFHPLMLQRAVDTSLPKEWPFPLERAEHTDQLRTALEVFPV